MTAPNLPPGCKLSDLTPEEPKQGTENIHAIGEDDYEREVSQSLADEWTKD